MNKELINNWNNKVSTKDEVHIIGDFMLGNGEMANDILSQLKGEKCLILGNHDRFVNDKKFDKRLFKWIRSYHISNDSGFKVVEFHYPIQSWEGRQYGSIHLYAHIHGNVLQYPLENAYNVGVDVRNLEPQTLKEILRE